MAKIYLSELSAVLAEKHGIDRRVAQRFVTSVVAVVQSGLESDRMVKVKGLGTFKIIDVEARESVNVNTGERLVIDSHSKLTFLPDNAMKELVNKPFSQFETVVLNDGVEFNDVAEEEETPAVEEENTVEEEVAPVVIEEKETPVVEEMEEAPVFEEKEEEVPVIEEKEEVPVVEEEAPMVEETESPTLAEELEEKEEEVEKAEEEPEEEEPKEQEPEEQEPEEEEAEEETVAPLMEEYESEPEKKTNWLLKIGIPLVTLLLGFGAGYLVGHGIGNTSSEEPKQPVAQVTQQTTEPQATEQETATEEEQQTEPQAEEESDVPIWDQYNDLDPRTRNGYYYITGLDRIEIAKANDNSSRIARRVFGAAELACYIEVFNGIDGRTVLEEGTEVKIPVIEPKKNVKRRLEQQNNQQ